VRRSSEAGERDLQAKADRVMDTGESVQALTQYDTELYEFATKLFFKRLVSVYHSQRRGIECSFVKQDMDPDDAIQILEASILDN